MALDLNASTLLDKPKDSRKQPLDGRPPSAAAAFTPRETLIFIFLVLTKRRTGEGSCPRRSGFNINGDSVKQANTRGGSWLPPHPGPHINEIMPQCSQLQPLSDRRLYSRTTSHHRLDPPHPHPPPRLGHHSFTCIHTGRTLSLRVFNQINEWVSHTDDPRCMPPPNTPPPPTNSARGRC